MADRLLILDHGDSGLLAAGTPLKHAVYADDGSTLRTETSTGISESPAGSGIYQVAVPNTWSGRIVWNDGSGADGYAVENFWAVAAAGAVTLQHKAVQIK